MIYNTILCVGDSMTYGARDEYGRGYPAELSSLMSKKYPDQFWICINEGVNGETTSDILRRLPHALDYREYQLIILQAGTNDCMKLTPLDIFKDNFYQLIKICQCLKQPEQNTKNIRRLIVGSLISLDQFGILYYGKNGAKQLIEYNKIIIELCYKLHIPYIDLTSLKKYIIDGVHLNNTGYKEMARLYMEAIENL